MRPQRYLAMTSCGFRNVWWGSPPGWVVGIVGFMAGTVRRRRSGANDRHRPLPGRTVTRRHVCWMSPAEVTMSAFGITESSEERRP